MANLITDVWRKEREYGELALAHAKAIGKPDALPTIEPGGPGWHAWKVYFVFHWGFVPLAMARVEDKIGKGKFTVPAVLPEHFDPSYTPIDRPLPPRHIDPSAHLTLPQRMLIVQRIRAEIAAAKQPEPQVQKPKAFNLYTEEELRRLYPPRQPPFDQGSGPPQPEDKPQ